MRSHAISGLCLIAACSAIGHDPSQAKPLEAPSPTGPAAPAEPAAARQPVSEGYCAAACSAAATQECGALTATCGYDTGGNGYVSVGGRVLHCKPACAAACAGQATGLSLCTRQCVAGRP